MGCTIQVGPQQAEGTVSKFAVGARIRLDGLAQERNQPAKGSHRTLRHRLRGRNQKTSKIIFLKTLALTSCASIHLLSFVYLAALPGDICNALLVFHCPLHKWIMLSPAWRPCWQNSSVSHALSHIPAWSPHCPIPLPLHPQKAKKAWHHLGYLKSRWFAKASQFSWGTWAFKMSL